MGDMGEVWQDIRLKNQVKKLQQLNWNTDVVMGLSVEYGFEVRQHTEYHMTLFNKKRNMWLDYWPSTSKAKWKNQTTKTFEIPDIEAYLMKHFKPE
jgi:hypothetical protein